ncbi:hypothetical protein QUC31_010220 [Theobroma cacao]
MGSSMAKSGLVLKRDNQCPEWKSSSNGFLKFNIDEVVGKDIGRAGIGGVLRDKERVIRIRFSRVWVSDLEKPPWKLRKEIISLEKCKRLIERWIAPKIPRKSNGKADELAKADGNKIDNFFMISNQGVKYAEKEL